MTKIDWLYKLSKRSVEIEERLIYGQSWKANEAEQVTNSIMRPLPINSLNVH